MPELPEVETTVRGLNKYILNLKIVDIWSSYESKYFHGKDNIKDPKYFSHFKKSVLNKKIVSIRRRAKNILIELENDRTILTHMKMTGHFLYGHFVKETKKGNTVWHPISPLSLRDPYNRHIRLVFYLSNGKYLALCDSRKFAKVTLIKTSDQDSSIHLSHIGPEPLNSNFSLGDFKRRVTSKPRNPIKQVLMDQSIIAGIGNIYADEALWLSCINPGAKVSDIEEPKLNFLFKAIKHVLSKGIDFGGDSMSDYRNIDGEKGAFQAKHNAYRKTGEKCGRRGSSGIIRRIVIGTRSAHYCDKHQKLN
jgi:formamidopyrimidine-DNA glycosylase